MQGQKKFFVFLVKSIEYILSALSVCSNPCVGPLPRIEISFFILSTFADEPISTPRIFTFFLLLPVGCEKSLSLSNPIPYPEYLYLSIPAFLVKVTAPK